MRTGLMRVGDERVLHISWWNMFYKIDHAYIVGNGRMLHKAHSFQSYAPTELCLPAIGLAC